MPASPLNNTQELIASRRTLVNSDSPRQCLVGPQFGAVLVWRNSGGAETTTAAWRAVSVPIWHGCRSGVSRPRRPRLDFGVERGKFCEKLTLLVIGHFRFEIHE